MAFDLITRKRSGRDWSICVDGDEAGAEKTDAEKTKERGIFVTILGVVGLGYFSMDHAHRGMQAASAASTAAGLYMWMKK